MALRIVLRNGIKALADLLFPLSCVVCGSSDIAPGFLWLCWSCRLKIQLIKMPFCERCGDPLDGAVFGTYLCINCRNKQADACAYFDMARSAGRYGGVLKEAILAFKYRRAFWLADDLASFIIGMLTDTSLKFHPEAITYVPLFHSRERHRTYNQARLLAEALGEKLNLPVVNVLERHKFTFTQTQLTAAERRDNVRGVFKCNNEKVLRKYKVLLLVDDVITTGATVEECAYALKLGGAEKVVALSVARG